MAGPERRGIIETGIHYGNYADVFFIGAGIATGQPHVALFGIASLAGGKWVENKMEERRKQGKFVL